MLIRNKNKKAALTLVQRYESSTQNLRFLKRNAHIPFSRVPLSFRITHCEAFRIVCTLRASKTKTFQRTETNKKYACIVLKPCRFRKCRRAFLFNPYSFRLSISGCSQSFTRQSSCQPGLPFPNTSVLRPSATQTKCCENPEKESKPILY